MNNLSLSSFNNKYLTLKGLTTKQKDALIAGGLTLGAVITGVGFYQLFGASNVVSGISSNSGNVTSLDEAFMAEDIAQEGSALTSESDMNDIATEVSDVSFSFHADVNISLAVSDDMSFADAFSAARQDLGAGGFFNYRGESYSTFHKEEWDGMAMDNRNDFLSQVEAKSDVTNYVEYSSVENQLNDIEPTIEEFEIVDESASEVVMETKTQNDAFEADDFFEGLAEEETLDAPAEDISIDNDDFFDSVTPDNDEENNQSQDDSEVVVPSIDEDDFFADLEDSEGEEVETSNDENVVIVRPVYGVDENSDGIIDMVAIDANEDGIADVVAIDDDNDGDFESFMVNEDGGDNLDVFIIDEGNDGIDASDSKESIDDIVSMEDFIVLDENEVKNIEDLELIESLIDGTEIIEDEEVSEELEDNDFDEIGL